MFTKHGMYRTPEYKAWDGMKRRCHQPNCESYWKYGARGITVCDEWRHDFLAFYNHIGPKPSPEHSVDRFPNKFGNYEPGNVRWATYIEQARNTRRNHYVTVGEETKTVAEWAEMRGVVDRLIFQRLRRGWEGERLFSPPDPEKVRLDYRK